VTLPAGTWHSIVALIQGSVFLEAKGGPYVALQDEEKARWAPGEKDEGALAYLEKLSGLLPRA
jgi:hypothetical protein